MKIEIDKPVVPVWFDDWYKTFNNNGGNNAQALYYLNRTGWGHALIDGNKCEVEGYYEKLHTLFDFVYEDAKEYLSKAIIVGYEVEQEPLYYARIKGWELTEDECTFWNYRVLITNITPSTSRLYTGDKEQEDFFIITKMTIEEWNEVGINDTNADFEKVKQ